MDKQAFFNCERLILLHGTNPKMGTRPTKQPYHWLKIIIKRVLF